ncbi:MAG: extracellular solute-binding protein [Planctomycetota bacterium]|nr:MAG: extracellular solute-binding protein [Planctomycetota bacterium]
MKTSLHLRNAGFANQALAWFLLSIVAVCAIGWLLLRPKASGPGSQAKQLRIFCAAGLKPAVVAAAHRYEAEYGVRIEFQFGGSGNLLNQLQVVRAGDLYLAGDQSFVMRAKELDLVQEVFPLAEMKPVLGVREGNPHQVQSMADALDKDLRIGLAIPEAAAIGRLSRRYFQSTGLWNRLQEKSKVFKTTVTELATDLQIGTLDVAVIWDATVFQFDGLQSISDPGLAQQLQTVALGVLKSSPSPTEALRFARFLAAKDRGAIEFAAAGYQALEGDPWHPHPELLMMSGAMLQPAIEQSIQAFEEREGVQIHRIYNGCGILVAGMQSGQRPDLYFSCDQSFMDSVSDWFQPPLTVSSNPMVILTQGGNPHQILRMEDFIKPGLKIGLGHPQDSALGALTERLLASRNLAAPLREIGNLVVESATGDYLVNQMIVGSLDAAIVYASNAALAGEVLEIVPIDDPLAFAVQPLATGKSTSHPQLAARLMRTLIGQDAEHRFAELGFHWRLEPASSTHR